MTLSDVLGNPFDPVRSLQLNNKYWPGDEFTLLSLLADAEALLLAGEFASAARKLRPLRSAFGDERFYFHFLRRLYRLRSFKSQFGCVTGRVELPEVAIKSNEYCGHESRASYSLRSAESFSELARRTAGIYADQYGFDVLRMNSTVRFARPDERQADLQLYGPLSDYHNDEYKGISTIVYLSDVTDENGAFSFIRGSELIPRSLILSALHQCVEFDMGMTTPEQLSRFPLEFRGSLAVGNFLDDAKVNLLLGFQETLEGIRGTHVTFNGQYVIHRGGKPVSGTRTAAFFQPEGVLLHKMRGVAALVVGATCSRALSSVRR